MRKVKYLTKERLIELNDEAIRTNRNRTLYPEKLEELPDGLKFPVSFSMLHNDCEIRMMLAVGTDELNLQTVFLDVPIDAFNSLPEVEVPSS